EGSVLGEVAQAPNSVANHVLQSADGVGDEVHREAGDVGDPVPDVAGRVAEPVDDTAEEVAVLAAGLVPAGLLRHALHTAGQGGVVQLIDRLAAECSGDLRAQDGLTTAKVQRAAGRRDEGVHILTGRVAGQDAAECEVPLGGVADAARHSNLRDRGDVEVVEDPVQSAEDAVIDDRVDDPDDRAGKRLAQAVPDILQAFDAAPEDRCDMLLDEAAEGVGNRADVVPPDVADPLRDPSPDRLDDLVVEPAEDASEDADPDLEELEDDLDGCPADACRQDDQIPDRLHDVLIEPAEDRTEDVSDEAPHC